MTEHLTFHESFDSTRCTADHPAHHPNLTQGQIEAVISLLLGRSLSINNTYGLDSRTFLELADVVLDTRGEVLERLRAREAEEELLRTRPFVLHRFAQPTFLQACIDQFERTEERAGDRAFRLSAWTKINDDAPARYELAKLLRQVEEGAPRAVPGWLVAIDPELGRRFDTLMRLDAFFQLPGADREARAPRVSVKSYIEHFATVADEDTETFQTIVTAAGCPADIADAVLTRVRRRAQEEDEGYGAVSRAWVHHEVARTDPKDPELFPLQQLQEFIDTLYNAVMADSAYAQFDYMSSTPRTDGRDELKHVNALALGVVRHRIQSELAIPATTERVTTRMGGLLSAASVLPHLPVNSLRSIFRAYWELQADDEDRLPVWRASARQLHEILEAPALHTGRLSAAWASHIQLLAQMLPDMVDADDTELRIAADGAGGVVQTQRLGSPAPGDLDRSISAGEHLARDFLRDLAQPAR